VAVNINYTYRPNYRTAGQGNEVDTTTRCRLKVTGFELRWEQEIFLISTRVQTDPAAHLGYCTTGTGALFLE